MKNKPSLLQPATFISVFLLLAGFLNSCTSYAQQESAEETESATAPTAVAVSSQVSSTSGDFEIRPPITSENLQVFLIHGKEEISGKTYLTLGEAMEQKKVKVNETGSVNELSIDNTSDEYIFIHSGDIVKGGKQDRTLSYDVIIPPKSKNVPLASFCVEQGRWRQRGNEALKAFSGNTKMLSSKELRLSAKYDKNQSKVWSKVAKQKDELTANVSYSYGVAVDIADSTSQSSLQLALENKELDSLKSERETLFKDILQKNPTAIGFAYAINGEVYGVDVYNNRKLFEDMWPKLLESILVESVSEMKIKDTAKDSISVATVEQVVEFMDGIALSEVESKQEKINEATVFRTEENKENYLVFSTEDEKRKSWVHKNYMKRDPNDTEEVPETRQLQNQIQTDQIQNIRQRRN